VLLSVLLKLTAVGVDVLAHIVRLKVVVVCVCVCVRVLVRTYFHSQNRARQVMNSSKTKEAHDDDVNPNCGSRMK